MVSVIDAWQTALKSESSVFDLVAVPQKAAHWSELMHFALTLDGYGRHRGISALAEVAEPIERRYEKGGELTGDLGAARATLFFEQRRWRNQSLEPTAQQLQYWRALVDSIRSLSGGVVVDEHPVV